MLRVFIDLDDVLVDFTKRACETHDVDVDEVNKVREGKWNLSKPIGLVKNGKPMSLKEFWKPINDWGPGFWLIPVKTELFDVADYLDNKEREGCLTWRIVTNPSNQWCPSGYEGKRKWFEWAFGKNFTKFELMDCKWLLSVRGSMLFDDRHKNIQDFQNKGLGGDGILVPSYGSPLNPWPDFSISEYIKHWVELRLAKGA